ncbi:MAG: hypothetical protein RLZZ408_259 [Verrucomicrobiota bacterium]
MGQIEAAVTGDQELAPHRWHPFVKGNLCTPFGRNFCSPKSRWTTANNREVRQWFEGRILKQ